jgi:hypothetical protein
VLLGFRWLSFSQYLDAVRTYMRETWASSTRCQPISHSIPYRRIKFLLFFLFLSVCLCCRPFVCVLRLTWFPTSTP